MIKIGDKVAHFMSMNLAGIVVDFKSEKVSYMTTGGTVEQISYSLVQMPSGEIYKYKTADLMKVFN
jgi:hypothetical protein